MNRSTLVLFAVIHGSRNTGFIGSLGVILRRWQTCDDGSLQLACCGTRRFCEMDSFIEQLMPLIFVKYLRENSDYQKRRYTVSS